MPFPPTRAIPSPCPVPPFLRPSPSLREGVEGEAPLGVRRPPPLRKKDRLNSGGNRGRSGGTPPLLVGATSSIITAGGYLLIKRVVPHAPSAPLFSLARRPFPASRGRQEKIKRGVRKSSLLFLFLFLLFLLLLLLSLLKLLTPLFPSLQDFLDFRLNLWVKVLKLSQRLGHV